MESSQTTKPTTRLMITHMVLENFKSYAGVQEIGPFHKRFSSIVGPNGSGKSNVIDALLFVFAKRASQLRLKKVSELIHKSSNYPNLDYAQVSVYFQLIHDDEASEDKFEVVPGSEFIISRVAYQNNTSKYMINSKTSTPSEVKELLDSFGIDLDNNRFLILQGEVEQIAMMKPKAVTPQEEGLLEYLEDIIGSNRHVQRIDEVSKVLDGINEKRIEYINKLKLAERDRDNLSGSKADAENFLEKERDIRKKQNILYQAFAKVETDNILDFQQRANDLNEKIAKEKNKRAERETELKEMDAAYKLAHRDYDIVNAELQKTSSEFAAFERRDIKLQEDLKYNDSQLKKAQSSLAKEMKKESESTSEAKKAMALIETSRKSVEDIMAKKSEEEVKIDEIMASLQDATKSLREKLEVTQGQLAEEERRTAGFLSEKEVIITRIQLLKSRADSAAANVNSIQSKLLKIQEDVLVSKDRMKHLEAEEKTLSRNLADAEKHRANLDEREAAVQASIRQCRGDLEDAKSRLASQKNGGSNAVVNAIMKAAAKGPLAGAGVHGRLGDLAFIDSEYDVAVSTACGMLDNIVVETTNGAQACLNFLKENNLGRATFILLDQMKEWRSRMSLQFKAPSGTHRIFDLITPQNESYLPAFYMALKDTLVANDLDSATAIAFVGDRAVHRVVTRMGDLIDTSGAMSGGGKELKSGAMRLSSAKDQTVRRPQQAEDDEITTNGIRKMEVALEGLESELQKLRAERDEIESRIRDMKNRTKSRSTDEDKEQAVLSSFFEQERELRTRLDKLSSETQLTAEEKQEVISLEARLQALDKDILRVSPNLKSLKQEVANLQNQIRDVGGPRLGKAQARLDILSTQLEKLTKELSSAEVDESNHRKQAIKSQGAREKLEKEIAKFDSKLKELMQEQQEMEQDALLVAQAVELAKSKMAEKETELKVMTDKYESIKKAMDNIKSVEVDLQQEINDNSKSLLQHKEALAGWTKQLDLVRKQHVDEQLEWRAEIESALVNVSSVSGVTEKAKEATSGEVDKLPDLTEELLTRAVSEIKEIKKEINLLEAERERLRGSVNMSALLEYLKKDAQYRVRVAELEAITEQRNDVRKEYEDLRRKRLEEFMTGFSVISLKLKEMYQMITLGGDAELELVDSLDPFSEGIVFTVRPKNKSWKNISNLSGGEKTLSSLALVFALHHYKPTPLYVMDEIDAALDFKNVSIVANYIKERTKNAQFVIISLRNNMFELADRLVGIYKTHDATKSVTINPKLISAEAFRLEEDSATIPTEQTVSKAVAPKAAPRRALADSTNIKA